MIMYILVKFNCDGLFHVNTEDDLRFSKDKLKARYKNYWYEAEIICRHAQKPVLMDIVNKLNRGDPFVNLNNDNLSEDVLPDHSLDGCTEIYDFEVLDDGQLMEISPQYVQEMNPGGNSQHPFVQATTSSTNFNPSDIIVLESIIIDTTKEESLHNAETNVVNESQATTKRLNVNSHVIRLGNKVLDVSTSRSHKKKYYCTYCMKLVTNFGRHIMTVHKSRREVEDISKLPKGHAERKEKLALIRRQAQHLYNTNPEINSGTLIVRRRPSAIKNRSGNHYMACPNCKEMFSKLSLRSHVAKCATKEKGKKDTLVRSRQIQMHVHEKASPRLVKEILAYNKQDSVTETIVYDEVCILYGNKLCRRYRDQRNNHMIRSRLREIGKFILQSKKIDETLKNVRDIIQPRNYDTIVKSINNVAGFNEMTGTYKAPSTAYNLGLHIKEITTLIQTEAIKEGNNGKRDATRDLLDLINDGFKTDINKTVSENQSETKRHKKVLLPTAEDINALKSFLEKGRAEALQILKSGFDQKAWKNLAGYTLISLQLFNRRRAGEIERILVQDFKSFQFVDTDDILKDEFKESMKYLSRNYARFFIRGKLNRQVTVILSRELINCIEVLLDYRDQYGVPRSNPYLFGVPGRSHVTLKACNLMRYYAKACGAPNPTRLRGTELRKQIATACSLYKLSEPLVEDMANHLGHHIDIHKKIYRQSIGRELPVVTNILLKALGEYDDYDEPVVEKDLGFSDGNNNMLEVVSTRISHEEIASDDISMSQDRTTINQFSPNNQEIPSLNDSGKQKRVSWTLPEIEAINNSFGDYIEQSIVPTFDECHKCRAENICLKSRTPPQIKSFVAYQTKKLKSNRKHSSRKAWSTSEKLLVEREFAAFLKSKKLPSLEKCKEVIAANHELSGRKPETLKAFINNVNKKAPN